MFKFFSNKNKKQERYSLEEQILTLKQLGLTFNVEDKQLVNSLLDQFNRDEFEEDPFTMILTISGAELFDEEDKEIRLSNDVWSFDTECVEDEKIYEYIVDQFTQLSKGNFILTKVESGVDFDNEIAKLSFEYKGIKYDWDIVFADDWVDFDLLRKLGNLANSNMNSKQYYYFHDGQQLTLFCCDLESIKKLNNLMKNPFTLLD